MADELVRSHHVGTRWRHVATLDALCELCSQYPSDDLVEKYHALRDFAGEHAEANAIFAAID
ncbi:hypothetical protein LMG26684_00699 [Achromobacter mucicolens]|nr:antirestriction protein [Achromobacter mucicolens]CAB3823350.1 hypothetical protein LMG26684_00699 [Achromobacter mucicolens]